MCLREIKPGLILESFVRLYRIIDLEFPHSNSIPQKHILHVQSKYLQFFPTPTIIDCAKNSKSIKLKNALLIGQHTWTNSRTVFKKFVSLQIIFQPGALHRVLGIPLNELTNQTIEAGDIIGSDIERVNNQLFHAKNHEVMISITERFLIGIVGRSAKGAEPIDSMAYKMLNPQKPLDWYISNSFLCHRQFDRKFNDCMGISPKEYLRIVQFDQA